MASKFYLTTPIYYVNARPHIGHAYTTIVADVLARRHRLLGDDTYFLTGTDEHGQKIERSAAAAGVPPQQFADQVSKSFSDLWARMGITNDDFIRTTEPRHARGVQKLFATLYERGQIYLSSYTGQYCVSEEMFVEGPPGTIGPDGRPTETVTEENFFFRLSDYQLPLLNLIESNELLITPESRRNEVLSFLRGDYSGVHVEHYKRFVEERARTNGDGNTDIAEAEEWGIREGLLKKSRAGFVYSPTGLRDLSVSRSSFTWGIPVPEPAASEAKEKHVIYVWLDALANYMTAIGYGSDEPADQEKFKRYWPADLHLVGKEIIRFHCVYWPAFLLAAGLPIPKAITAHGWLLFDDSKMSKSKGNIVRTETILDAFGTLCPPAPSAGNPDPGGPSFAPSAKGGVSDEVRPSSSTPPQTPVILSEAIAPSAIAQSMDPDAAHLTSTASPFSTGSGSLKGTASAVPSPAPNKHAALAAEGISPHDRDLFAADILRYFLLREIPFGQDGSFSFDALITRYNADLANGYGNLVSRTLSMIEKYFGGTIPNRNSEQTLSEVLRTLETPVTYDPASIESFAQMASEMPETFFEKYEFFGFLRMCLMVVGNADQMLSQEAPWKLDKATEKGKRAAEEVLYAAAESIRIITALLYPILPYATANVWRQLGLGDIELAAKNGELKNLQWGGLKPGTKLGPLSPIFPRAPKELAQTMADMESPKDLSAITDNNDATHPASDDLPTAPIASEAPKSKLVDESFVQAPTPTSTFDPAAGPRTGSFTEPSPGSQVAGSNATTTERPGTPSHIEASSGIFSSQSDSPQISIDDFVKIDLRVAKIVVAERIPKADKLLRLEVDLGYETRQILSGIAEFYTPEELIGRRIVVIANLAPRKMRGLESHGMLLAASAEGGKPILATFPEAEELPLGSRLK